MSVHNTEVHRCRECNEVVIIVPEGFTIEPEDLQELADEHELKCPVILERTSKNE